MKQKKPLSKPITAIILTVLTIVFIAKILSGCKSTDPAFIYSGEKPYYVFYSINGTDWKSSEPLSVFIDREGCFHIFELENKIHYSTASRTKFINELYMICSKKYYKRIAYLTVNRKSNRYAVIEDIITDSTLLQITGYKTEDGHSYKNVRLIESPDIELRFCFGDDFVFE
ncbi:MAG: hypothetical protein IK002_02535 [Treponema sp.]|uniref:hypothetical protein n=1 Tax=Treponema sp. TaxID=166 RepID=UPI00298DD041|nr:hypothetical protein [Treponema sp.]MBR5932842.1 hypothetical protein [Treponema sp.]